MEALLSFSSWIFNFEGNEVEPEIIKVKALPGLTTLLDVALFRVNQAELASTISTGRRLLQAWIDLKDETNMLIEELYQYPPSETISHTENQCRIIIDAAEQAIEKISTDRLAASASIAQSQDNPDPMKKPRPKDSWESFRLHCPDYIWADEVLNLSKVLKNLQKHSNIPMLQASPNVAKIIDTVKELINVDIPARLSQFKAATEADAITSQRLYLIKLEYRAPLRAFWETQQSVKRAPDESMFETSKSQAKQQLKQCIDNQDMLKALVLEKHCSELERDIMNQILPFAELARWFEAKYILLDESELVKRTLRRLRKIQRKGGFFSIKPLLLDLQGADSGESIETNKFELEVELLLKHLSILNELTKVRHESTQSNVPLRVLTSIAQGCQACDIELLRCQFDDWYQSVLLIEQVVKNTDLEKVAQDLQRAELQNGLASASASNVSVVMERVKKIQKDRELRFAVAKTTIEEVAFREMNLRLDIELPPVETILQLKPSSALGIFGDMIKEADLPN